MTHPRCENQLESLPKCRFSDLQLDLKIHWVCGGGQESEFLRNILPCGPPSPTPGKLMQVSKHQASRKETSLLERLCFPFIVWLTSPSLLIVYLCIELASVWETLRMLCG